ncbi:MAG TPA: hypothetical protein VGM78_13060, partial [Ilumatobacteraceae bacterium]
PPLLPALDEGPGDDVEDDDTPAAGLDVRAPQPVSAEASTQLDLQTDAQPDSSPESEPDSGSDSVPPL